MEQRPLLLSIAYLPPISYMALFMNNHDITIEQHENYTRQTYRNRCTILAANGPLDLNIPVKLPTHPKSLINDVLVDYDTNWQRIHLKALESAYKNAPFYDYYMHDFLPFYNEKPRFLFDFNLKLIETLFQAMGKKMALKLSESFVPPGEIATLDLRYSISPKVKTENWNMPILSKNYTQVFSEKFDFIPNLSIVDALFNLGPDVERYCKSDVTN